MLVLDLSDFAAIRKLICSLFGGHSMTSSLLDRSQYPCLRDNVYLNQASLGLIGQPAVAAMHGFLETVARHGNLYMSDHDEINYGHTLRGVASRLFHSDPSRIAILA